MTASTVVAERLDHVRARIESAAGRGHRVKIVAVTKGFGTDVVEAAVNAGLQDCGENYAQELVGKAEALRGAGVEVLWHFLGPVQRNKVRKLESRVALWQGLDHAAAATEIAKRAPGAAVLVQVNLSGNPARPGCAWGDTASVVETATAVGLQVRGLMGVAGGPGEREQFRRLAQLASDLGLEEVSMGMSGDFEVAVQEGATMVRIGTALFGARPRRPKVRR